MQEDLNSLTQFPSPARHKEDNIWQQMKFSCDLSWGWILSSLEAAERISSDLKKGFDKPFKFILLGDVSPTETNSEHS